MRRAAKVHPGRVINECTGNWVDIFMATKQTAGTSSGDEVMVGSLGRRVSSPPTWVSSKKTTCKGKREEWCAYARFSETGLFPLKPCMFDNHTMLCPNNVSAYLADAYPGVHLHLDHQWNSTLETYVKDHSYY